MACIVFAQSYDRRKRFVRDTETKYWDFVGPACMTEESDGEDADSPDKIVTHRLTWRSECKYHCAHTHTRVPYVTSFFSFSSELVCSKA